MSNEEKFNFDSLQDPQTIKRFLESLVEGFDKGRIILTSEETEMILYPDDLLKFSIKGKKKGDSSKLSLKFSWKDTKKNAHSDDPSSIKISS